MRTLLTTILLSNLILLIGCTPTAVKKPQETVEQEISQTIVIPVSGVGDVNTIQYVTITTLGDALDFGDLTRADQQVAGGSNSHGGLSG